MLDQQTSQQDGSLNLGKQPAKSIWKLPQNPAFSVNYSFYWVQILNTIYKIWLGQEILFKTIHPKTEMKTKNLLCPDLQPF